MELLNLVARLAKSPAVTLAFVAPAGVLADRQLFDLMRREVKIGREPVEARK